jgi:hypothetical protein
MSIGMQQHIYLNSADIADCYTYTSVNCCQNRMTIGMRWMIIGLAASFFSSITVMNTNNTKAIAETENRFSCPTKIETLVDKMLLDLPSYSNRVIQRTRSIVKDKTLVAQRYIVLAGKAEYEPLPLNNSEYQPQTTDSSQQVFFTTFEREYRRDRIIETQNYHWLFLAQTASGWRLVAIYSRFGLDSDAAISSDLTMPPQDTTEGAIGQGINLWLKDCRAGVVSFGRGSSALYLTR